MSTTIIDCRTCPVRGQMCGDCFVPVMGRAWLGEPSLPCPSERPLDAGELAAVGAFVRAGLVSAQQAAEARAEHTDRWSRAAG